MQLFSKHLFTQFFWMPKPLLTEDNLPDQTGKVHLITGGYSGIGKELASILYQRNATIYIAGRDQEKAAKAIDDIDKSHPTSTGRLEFIPVDMSDLTTIKHAVETFTSRETRLDVLVNNAGVMVPPLGSKGKQGHELQLVTNGLGPFLLAKSLTPILKRTAAQSASASVRIIWASSVTVNLFAPAGGVTLDDHGVPVITSSQPQNYAQSKAANNLYAVEFSRRHAGDGIVSVSFNPGNLTSGLQRHLNLLNMAAAVLISHPARYGAYTELYAGWSPDIGFDDGGVFVVPWGRKNNPGLRSDILQSIEDCKTRHDSVARRLWQWSDKETEQYL